MPRTTTFANPRAKSGSPSLNGASFRAFSQLIFSHGATKHERVWWSAGHALVGGETVRERTIRPRLQAAEHADHSPHGDVTQAPLCAERAQCVCVHALVSCAGVQSGS